MGRTKGSPVGETPDTEVVRGFVRGFPEGNAPAVKESEREIKKPHSQQIFIPGYFRHCLVSYLTVLPDTTISLNPGSGENLASQLLTANPANLHEII
jgi:hypothetical protein